jgi:hypothetical protein
MDISDLARLYTVIQTHRDVHVFGNILGKVTKLLAQAYMSGVLDHAINLVLFFVAPDLQYK